MAGRRPSELESFVLGLIWQMGPCSPYELRRYMQLSPSTQWSGSAGAIYPLVTRLQRRGFLASKAAKSGKRRRREYTITPAGLKALRAWVAPPIPAEAVTVSHDPLRSRARFLEVLTPEQRTAWVKAARAALDEIEERVRQWGGAARQFVQAEEAMSTMTRSGMLDIEARRVWIGELDKR